LFDLGSFAPVNLLHYGLFPYCLILLTALILSQIETILSVYCIN